MFGGDGGSTETVECRGKGRCHQQQRTNLLCTGRNDSAKSLACHPPLPLPLVAALLLVHGRSYDNDNSCAVAMLSGVAMPAPQFTSTRTQRTGELTRALGTTAASWPKTLFLPTFGTRRAEVVASCADDRRFRRSCDKLECTTGAMSEQRSDLAGVVGMPWVELMVEEDSS